MKVLVTIQHPAHVHFFRNAITELESDGHETRVFCREKDIAVELLEEYDIDYEVLAGTASSFSQLVKTQATYELRLLNRARKFNPDVMTAIAEPGVTHVSRLVGARSVLFTDTEHAALQNRLAFPFAHRICTPECYMDDLGPKQVRYPGYHELAYLHPDRFEPDPNVLREAGIDPDQKIALVRSVAWNAAHDRGQKGFGNVDEVVQRIEDTGSKVVLSAEGDVPESVESNVYSLPPHKIHHLMAFADVFVGESSTMAAECAVLGTPAVYVNTLELGYINELSKKYGLIDHVRISRDGNPVDTAISRLEADSSKWKEMRSGLLNEKDDTTKHILKNILN